MKLGKVGGRSDKLSSKVIGRCDYQNRISKLGEVYYATARRTTLLYVLPLGRPRLVPKLWPYTPLHYTMDSSAVNINVTVDDFDAIVNYADQSQWFTPDPFSAGFDAKNSPWWMGTFHKTETVGASFSFNFTGTHTLPCFPRKHALTCMNLDP